MNSKKDISMTGGHFPVLLETGVDLLNVRAGHVYVDATAGAGGHLKRICQKAGSGEGVIAIDQDLSALEKLRNTSEKFIDEIKFVHANFADLKKVLSDLSINTVDGGIIADIGISSNQLDDSTRGFSFQRQGPLDMRMNVNTAKTAADLVNDLDENELANIIISMGRAP